MPSIQEILQGVSGETHDAFVTRNTVLSFAEWMGYFRDRPYTLTRSAPQYIRDMMLFFGTEEVDGVGGTTTRFCLFDGQRSGTHRVVGQEAVQMEIFETLQEFVQRGLCDRLILLHGPNGAAKTSIVQAMMEGMLASENYCEVCLQESLSFLLSRIDELQ